jgi:citrate synthase
LNASTQSDVISLVIGALGFEQQEFTCVLALSRMIGWYAHVHEQNQCGQLMRPSARYVGPMPGGVGRLTVSG